MTPTAKRPGDRTGEDREWGVRTVVVLLVVAGILVAFRGLADWLVVTWTGPMPEARDAAASVLIGAALVLGGALVAGWRRRALTTALLGCLGVLLLIGGGVMYAAAAPDTRGRIIERVPTCQEHSGEPNTCPGG